MLMLGQDRSKSFYGKGFIIACLVSLATLLLYLPALQNDFVEWDDAPYVFENPDIRSFDLTLFKWAISTFYLRTWHPLTWISHALDYAIWGLNPMGHHLTSVILHGLNTFLVVVLILKLLKAASGFQEAKEYLSDRGILAAAVITGLLFGLHPLHVESVAWISERKDLLCAFFFLLSTIMYIKYVEVTVRENSGSQFFNKQYLLSLGFFILALLSKAMAVSLPLVLLVLDWYPLKRIRSLKTFGYAFVGKLPFFSFGLISSILAVLANSSEDAPTEDFPLSMRLLAAVKSLITYLWKMALPFDLQPLYPYPKNISILSSDYLTAIVLFVGATILCVIVVKRHPLWLSVWSYYVISIIPVLGIVQISGHSMADRYTYLPSIGPFLIVGLAAGWFYDKVTSVKQWGFIFNLLAVATVIFIFASMAYLTFEQIRVWKTSFSLWNYVIEKNPAASLAYYSRGNAYQRIGLIDKAFEDFDKAIALSPLFKEAYYNRGTLYGKAGLYEKSLMDLNKSIALNPNYVDAYCNRGIVHMLVGQYNRALEDFNKAILLNQSNALAYLNRGELYQRTGNKELASSDFRKACDLGKEFGCEALQKLRMHNN